VFDITHYPLLVFASSFIGLWLAARLGQVIRRKTHSTTHDEGQLERVNANTAQLQTELWAVAQAQAAAQPPPIIALAVSGMNDVLNSQGYTQAAYWNRIPTAAWGLMAAIAICCNLLLGFGSHNTRAGTVCSSSCRSSSPSPSC
jgi:hypothetical protein